MGYAHPYTTSEQLFGRRMTAEELISRVRTYSWKEAFIRLAQLSGLVANSSAGAFSEDVRRRTVDQIPKLSGGSATLLAHCRRYVGANRDGIVLAHDEGLLFLQHLVLLEGADDGAPPSDAEIALWLAGGNDHLDHWTDGSDRSTTSEVALMAEMIRIHRFNNTPDTLAELVRTRVLFGTQPAQGELADTQKWASLDREAFGAGFSAFFETLLGPLYLFSLLWGIEGSKDPRPVLNVPKFVSETNASRADLEGFLSPMVGSRDELRAEIRRRTRADGLPHAPTALLHRPLVEIAPQVFVAASPWAVRAQVQTAVWWRYLSAAKRLDPRKGANSWFSTFGYMVEYWCRTVAEKARLGAHSAHILLPSTPGAPDEIEDVVVLEQGAAVMFSVKSRLVDARASRDAISPQLTIDWFEDFFFEKKGNDYRGGAIRLLDSRIGMVRSGTFEHLGVTSQVRIYPVIVTYDDLGDHDLFFRWLEQRCKHHGLLQQADVGPLAILRVRDFEQLMSRVGEGRSVVDLLRNREAAACHRRIDQLIYEDGRPARLPFFDQEHRRLVDSIKCRLFSTQTPST